MYRNRSPIWTKTIDLQLISLPEGIQLTIDVLDIRAIADPYHPGYLYLTGCAQAFEDDEGFPWEKEFTSSSFTGEFYEHNSVFKGMLTDEVFALGYALTLEYLQPSIGFKHGHLLLHLTVRGTPMRGHLVLAENMFKLHSSIS